MEDITASVIAKALGKRGGQTTLDKYGKDHFKKISKKAAIARKANREAAAKLA